MAQWLTNLTRNHEVAGSIPALVLYYKVVAYGLNLFNFILFISNSTGSYYFIVIMNQSVHAPPQVIVLFKAHPTLFEDPYFGIQVPHHAYLAGLNSSELKPHC